MGLTNPKWLIGILMAFIVLTLISGVIEGTYIGADEVTTLKDFVRPPLSSPSSMYTWLTETLWTVLWFDYAFFHGGWSIFRYAIFLPVSAGVVISYGAILIQAMIVALRSVAGGVGALLRR